MPPRLGFHYYPDTIHYRQSDLQAWLPELSTLGISWLTLQATDQRAIPEHFLKGLLQADIEPIIHLHLPLEQPPSPHDAQILFQTYARWGAHYIALFDRPNTLQAWGTSAWSQNDLVEQFLDIFLPLADAALQVGLIPIFPPLEPGGDYWDTSFLRAALEAIQRRGHQDLLDSLVIGAYAWADKHPLNWGAGGPERWPETRPYITPDGEEDQCGFRIFDWYLTLIQAATGNSGRVLLLGMGHRLNREPDPKQDEDPLALHTETNLQIARLLDNEQVVGQEPIPEEIIGGCFWLLTASPDSPFAPQSWYPPDSNHLPIVDALHRWVQERPSFRMQKSLGGMNPAEFQIRPIAHYVLLPNSETGISQWHLDIIRPYINKYQPTVGFSVEEAQYAAKVTVIGGRKLFSKQALEKLQASGCHLELIEGDGSDIATQLAKL
jgi:hypothetical protein